MLPKRRVWGRFPATLSLARFFTLVGPNGAGKSTLLARMAGLTFGEGTVIFDGASLETWPAAKLAQHRAYLAQQQNPPIFNAGLAFPDAAST
ncbi:vitamin B12-transporter ATPase [Citrobacter koseri]|nr:vitamin B12-transporter ATPase [Citrobacter koseri]